MDFDKSIYDEEKENNRMLKESMKKEMIRKIEEKIRNNDSKVKSGIKKLLRDSDDD